MACIFFRLCEMTFGCLPHGGDLSLGPCVVLMSFPGSEVRFGPDGRVIRAQPGTVLRRLRATATAFLGTAFCFSVLAVLPPANPRPSWAGLGRLSWGTLVAEYCRGGAFAGCLSTIGNLFATHIALWHGYEVLDMMRNPVLLSQVASVKVRVACNHTRWSACVSATLTRRPWTQGLQRRRESHPRRCRACALFACALCKQRKGGQSLHQICWCRCASF